MRSELSDDNANAIAIISGIGGSTSWFWVFQDAHLDIYFPRFCDLAVRCRWDGADPFQPFKKSLCLLRGNFHENQKAIFIR